MSFTRRTNSGSINNVCTFDYNHTAKASGRYNYDGVWQGQRDSPSNSKYLYNKPVDVNCGELRATDRNMTVHMTGRVKFQKLNKFIAMRDSHGTTQLVVLEERLDIMKSVSGIPADSHMEIIGTVQLRPERTINVKMATGDIEVVIDEILDVFTPKRKIDEISGGENPWLILKKARSVVPMTTVELSRCVSNAARKKYQQRTYHCNELNESLDGLIIRLSGWVEDKRNDDYFGTLKDGYGSVQLIIKKAMGPVESTFKKVNIMTTLVHLEGTVQIRPTPDRNLTTPSRGVEVVVISMEIIDPNEPDLEDSQNDETKELDEQLSDPGSGSVSSGGVNRYCTRTHTCGELRSSDVGKDVVLYGWLANQRLNRFAQIRDGHGSTQLIAQAGTELTLGKVLIDTPLESVIRVSGTVCARPEDQISKKMSTGEIEVLIKEYDVLNPAKSDMPFIIREHNRPKENVRMKYRYLDLRFEDMQYRLRLRSKALMLMREFLINKRGFVEVETPTLFRRTPGGAQEYVVPTRIEGKFYSLVQSPQQLKQLLMIGCMDRYFQVARCYRDEGARPDRQPEFTQMDIELSFTDEKQIMLLIEDLLRASFPDKITSHTRFPVIKHQEAMHWYGTDKPDLSFDKKLVDISELIENHDLLPRNIRDVKNFTAKVLLFDSSCDNKTLIDLVCDCEEEQKMKGENKCKFFVVKCYDKWKQAMEKTLPFLNAEKLKNTIEFPIPSTIVAGIGQESQVLPMMGKLRNEMFRKPTTDLHFAWIVDFPLFIEEEDGALESAHHPFTQPNKEDIHLLKSDPLKVRGLHFDLVLNGYEVGGGSVRIHDPVLQTKILKDILKIPTDSLHHLLEALASGAPPHGGIALGIDRLLSIVVGADTIRDVIAFPKGVDGKDPMSGAPCSISNKEKKLYHLIPRS